MKKIKTVILGAGILLCILFLILETTHKDTSEPAQSANGMFAWDEETVENPEIMKELIKELEITRWYQEFPEKIDKKMTASFMDYMNDQGVKADALVGSVDWGFEEDGASLIECIAEIDSYNKGVSRSRRICGIMVDVEPYITEEFKSNREYYMDIYVKGMKRAYSYAKDKEISFIACIPRHYEEQGLEEGLEELIAKACDEVAVMNYGRGNETEMIATEAMLAQKYDKTLHCILEFQNVGVHGLTEKETYREEGIEAAIKTWAQVRESYPKTRMAADYHWTRPLLEMLKGE